MINERFFPAAALAISVGLFGCGDKDSMNGPSTAGISSIGFDALFVVNGGSNTLSVIDVTKNEIAGTISLKDASFPHHANLSPDRTFLALAIPGMDLSGGHSGNSEGMHGMMKGAVLRLDALTGETKASRTLDAPNHNAVFSPDAKEIWTSQMTMDGKVLVLDATTLATKQTIKVGDMPAEISFSKDGKYVFVANGMSNTVTVLDAATKSVVKTIPVGEDPVGAWQGANGIMYVDNETGKSLTAIDASTLEIVRTYKLGFMPGMAATAPNDELWVTDSENGKVVFYSTTADLKLGELTTGAGAHAIAFSADGKTGYISNQSAGTVSVIDIALKTVTKFITVGSKPNGMVFRSKL